jgi:glucose/arabinose dehydrogenase
MTLRDARLTLKRRALSSTCFSMRRFAFASSALLLIAACTNNGSSSSTGAGAGTSTGTGGSFTEPDGSVSPFCKLPGTVQFTDKGTLSLPGAQPGDPDLSFLHLPAGFCAHYFGTVGDARQLRFAPGGELFVASPTQLTTGGNAQAGQASIVVLPDDNHDGRADTVLTFMGGLPSTQGLMFIPGFFYYQDDTKIMRVPYKSGDRTPSGTPEQVVSITYYNSPLHWPKVMDIADDGSIYIGNGGDQGETCDGTPHAFHGGIRKVTDTTTNAMDGEPVAQGFRNPIAIRCLPGHDTCFALELALDYSAGQGGREKMVPIHLGDDWGYPCCATQNLAYSQWQGADCSKVTPDTVSWLIGDTPFGLAFAPSTWPGMWAGAAIVTTHGAAGSWVGARMVAIAMDASTGMPKPGTNMNGQDMGSMTDFATGWDDGTLMHGRPAAVELAPDGRLFVANDSNGMIFWIAPLEM